MMTGLEQITNSILGEAQAEAEKKIAAAKARIAEIKTEYEQEIARVKAEAEEKKKLAKKRADENTAAALRAREREALLETQNKTAEEIIAAAKEKILTLPDKEYFSLLAEIYKNNAEKGEAEILFSAEDKKRMPDGFIAELNKICEKVTLSDEDAPAAGFIIRRGRVEQNCTIEAIFEDRKNELADIVAARCKE